MSYVCITFLNLQGDLHILNYSLQFSYNIYIYFLDFSFPFFNLKVSVKPWIIWVEV